MDQAQILLSILEAAAASIGLHINHKKAGYLKFNQRDADLTTLAGDKLKQVDDFKYLGSWVSTSRRYMEVRIGLGKH